MSESVRYFTSIGREIIESPDEYRGSVCMALREWGHDNLADELGGWSDERIASEFDGFSPQDAARSVIRWDQEDS